MTISEDLLVKWAGPPGDSKAQTAYGQISSTLNTSTALLGKTVDIYLQGSYRNRTHIKADSDVDIVAELQSSFFYNIDNLDVGENALFKQIVPDATYKYEHFKRDVLQALVNTHGAGNVVEGNKCLKVAGNASRSNADVLACLEHRTYRSFAANRQTDYIPGIKFFTKSGSMVINWPKTHFSNGSTKNQETDEKFKHLVRIFKNIRKALVDGNALAKENAPSYFIECLVFNVPNPLFRPTYSACLANAIGHFQGVDIAHFTCVNGLESLFGSTNGWDVQQANSFIGLVDALNQAA